MTAQLKTLLSTHAATQRHFCIQASDDYNSKEGDNSILPPFLIFFKLQQFFRKSLLPFKSMC